MPTSKCVITKISEAKESGNKLVIFTSAIADETGLGENTDRKFYKWFKSLNADVKVGFEFTIDFSKYDTEIREQFSFVNDDGEEIIPKLTYLIPKAG